jgi:hypothetical protein
MPFGPVETEEISQLIKDKQAAEKSQMRTLLMEQMRERSQREELERRREKELDQIFARNATMGLAVENINKAIL